MRGQAWIIGLALAWTAVAAAAAPSAPDDADGAAPIVEDEDVPYGIASGWLIGHRLLAEGDAPAALPYLHMAYRGSPGVPAVARDFLAALRTQGYLDDALNVANVLVADFPDSLDFLLLRASVFVQRGQPDRALADLRALRAGGGWSPQAVLTEASLLGARGQGAEAVAVLREGLALFPQAAADLYLGLAAALNRANQAEQIPPLMREAAAALPGDPRLRLVLIRALVDGGRDEEALQASRQADADFRTLPSASGPDGPERAAEQEAGALPGLPQDSFQVELADLYAQRGRAEEGVAILQALAAAGDLQLEPSLWLARMLLGGGKQEEAAGLIEDILQRWPQAGRAWFLQGKRAEGQGDWAGALPWFRKAAELAPQDPEIRVAFVRAMLLAWEPQLRAAPPDSQQSALREEFRRNASVASALVPAQDTEGQLILGYSLRLLGEVDKAADRFKLAAENPDLRLNALVQASICYDDLGRSALAQDALETLRRESPENPEVANSLGYFLAEKNQDLDRAEALVKEALAADPNNGAYLDSMGWVYYRQRRLDDALDYLVRAVNVQPEDPVILEHLGVVLKEQGQNEQARGILERALTLGGDAARLRGLLDALPAAPAGQEP